MINGLPVGIVLTFLALPQPWLTAQTTTARVDACGRQDPPTNGPVTGGDIRNLRYFGSVNRDRTQRVLDELVWHKTLAGATRSARLKDRPIVLIQALGDVRGLC